MSLLGRLRKASLIGLCALRGAPRAAIAFQLPPSPSPRCDTACRWVRPCIHTLVHGFNAQQRRLYAAPHGDGGGDPLAAVPREELERLLAADELTPEQQALLDDLIQVCDCVDGLIWVLKGRVGCWK